ncbi:MAG: hypothetical protein H7301_09285 [Cryobacterium sp.]|nr:hypothetical protein [Oligoflexia bacterium]
MNPTSNRLRLGGLAVLVTLEMFSLDGKAAPSNQQAWKDEKSGVTVYHDELDPAVFWYIPQIRFESAGGQTVLRPHTLANGETEYAPRIIPYLSDLVREKIFADLSEIRMESQLRPVIARNIGVALPDFGAKLTTEAPTNDLPDTSTKASASTSDDAGYPADRSGGYASGGFGRTSQTPDPVVASTNIQYLNIPRLFRFHIAEEDAGLFQQLLDDAYGVPVSFTISYDGVVRDKYYQISVSCKDMSEALSHNGGFGVEGGTQSFLGATLEAAYKKAVQNNLGGIDIVSKGDLSAMSDALRSTLDFCFQPLASYERNSDPVDDRICQTDSTCLEPNRDGTLLAKASARLRYRFKKSVDNQTRQAAIKHVNMADSVSTAVVMSALKKSAPVEPRSLVQTISTSLLVLKTAVLGNRPTNTGLKIERGIQYTVQASYRVKSGDSFVTLAQASPSLDSFLAYRIGSDDWRPVNRYFTIDSDIARGGALQFQIDAVALRKALPAKYKFFGAVPEAEFTVQVVAKKIRNGTSSLANR